MKILLTLFDIQDFGGIMDDVEFLGRGFREAGHECDLIYLRCSEREPYMRSFNKRQPGDQPSVFGGSVNALRGWDGVPVYGYSGNHNVRMLHRKMEEYDLVIHEIPNPKPDPEDWWKRIYDADVPQIIAAHDAHYREHYPHIAEIAHRIVAITCTNHAGYVALEHFPAPRAFIGAAHKLEDWTKDRPFHNRKSNSVCAHVWKAWKRMDKVVAAGPHLQRSGLIMAGDGIEGRYMRSVDKVKPKYRGLWDAFLDSGHCGYLGLIAREDLYSIYRNSRVMVDMSYSAKFARLGNHFNRSILEAANNGCISICTIENMRENSPQVELFKDGVTHIGVHTTITPKELAEVMDWATNDVSEDSHMQMVWNVRKVLVDHFDYRKTYAEYLKLAQGLPAGIYPELETGYSPVNTGV